MVDFPCLPSSPFLNTGAFLVAAAGGGASTPPATAGGRWEIRPVRTCQGPGDGRSDRRQEAALDADAQQAKWKVGIGPLCH